MEIVKVAFIAVLTVLFYALLRQIKPEIAPLVIIGGAAVIIIFVVMVIMIMMGIFFGT